MSTDVRLKAYDLLHHGIRHSRGEDGRVGSTHNRMNRSFILVPYADKVVRFLPIKQWQSHARVTGVTFRHWLKRGVITAYNMYGMSVMCSAELAALRRVIDKRWNTLDMHKATDPEFRRELSDALCSVRLALDSYRKHLPLTVESMKLIEKALETPHA